MIQKRADTRNHKNKYKSGFSVQMQYSSYIRHQVGKCIAVKEIISCNNLSSRASVLFSVWFKLIATVTVEK